MTGLGRDAKKLATGGGAEVVVDTTPHPFEKMHTLSLPLAQAEDAIHALAGHIPGMNPIHLAIEPGAPRVTLPG